MPTGSSAKPSVEQRRAIHWQVAEAELISELLGAAERIRTATDLDGTPIVRTDALWSLLRALERAEYGCSISDAARLLRSSRQYMQRLAHKAQRAGAVELVTTPDDARTVLLDLTPRARLELARATRNERSWAGRLLLGLDMPRMLTVTRVLRVIRLRLARDA